MRIHTTIGHIILGFIVIVSIMITICFGYLAYDIFQEVRKRIHEGSN